MSAYKVLKDFPSRNGVRQYKVGQIIHLDENSRTKALSEWKYIEKIEVSIAGRIAVAIRQIRGVRLANVKQYGARGKRKYLNVEVEVKE